MPSKRAVLILKGDIPADKILEVLASLMEKYILRVAKSETAALEPCNVFTLICGSGNAGYDRFLVLHIKAYSG
jgi:hypothetical protein